MPQIVPDEPQVAALVGQVLAAAVAQRVRAGVHGEAGTVAACATTRHDRPRADLWQQAKFDDFIDCYNHERPHQALDMKYPAELYLPSPRPYRGLSELHYPFHDQTITVTQCRRICFGRRKINLSTVFAGQNVGIKEVSDKIWLVSIMDYDLGFFDHQTGRLGTADNPFAAKVLPMSPE